MNTIVINKVKKDFKAIFFRGTTNVYEITCLSQDLKYIKKAHTKGFEKATVIKTWLKPKKKTARKKATTKRKTAAKTKYRKTAKK